MGNGGSVEVTTDNLSIANGAVISASTFGQGDGGDLTFNIGDRLALEENGRVSAEVIDTNANGGNITINAEDAVVVAFPENEGDGNDIVTKSPEGRGGDIDINAQWVLGFEIIDVVPNETNSIDASGTVDGLVNINTPNTSPVEGASQPA
jgi:large exoprotein involved in heme utilization and adhesion